MDAELIHCHKSVTPEGWIIELEVWRVPAPVPPSTHRFKYSAVFVVDGERVIGFDNERGKGDHCHIDGVERAYKFVDPRRLSRDLEQEIDRWRTEHSR